MTHLPSPSETILGFPPLRKAPPVKTIGPGRPHVLPLSTLFAIQIFPSLRCQVQIQLEPFDASREGAVSMAASCCESVFSIAGRDHVLPPSVDREKLISVSILPV